MVRDPWHKVIHQATSFGSLSSFCVISEQIWWIRLWNIRISPLHRCWWTILPLTVVALQELHYHRQMITDVIKLLIPVGHLHADHFWSVFGACFFYTTSGCIFEQEACCFQAKYTVWTNRCIILQFSRHHPETTTWKYKSWRCTHHVKTRLVGTRPAVSQLVSRYIIFWRIPRRQPDRMEDDAI